MERPKEVGLSVKVMIATLVLGLVSTIVAPAQTTTSSSAVSAIVIFIITCAITGFIQWKIYQGRNWARITNLVLFTLGIIAFLAIVGRLSGLGTFYWLISVVQIALQAYAIYLVFSTPGKVWFQKQPATIIH